MRQDWRGKEGGEGEGEGQRGQTEGGFKGRLKEMERREGARKGDGDVDVRRGGLGVDGQGLGCVKSGLWVVLKGAAAEGVPLLAEAPRGTP